MSSYAGYQHTSSTESSTHLNTMLFLSSLPAKRHMMYCAGVSCMCTRVAADEGRRGADRHNERHLLHACKYHFATTLVALERLEKGTHR